MRRPTSTSRESFWQTLTRPIVALLALQLLGGMMLSPHLTFFPIYIKELGYSAMLIANISAAKQVAGLIASLVGGTLSDALGRKRTLLLGNVGSLLSSFVFLIGSPTWIGLLWAIGGLGMGLHTLGGQSYLMDAANPHYLGVISALYNWGYTFGGALGSPIVGQILERGSEATGAGYNVLAWTMITFSMGTLAFNQFVLPRSPAERQAHAPNLKRFFGYGDIATRPTVLMLAVLRFLPTLYYATTLILIPLLLDAAGASKPVIAWYATVSWVAASIAQAIVGRAADRWGPKSSTALTFTVLFLSAFGAGLWPSSLWAVLVFGTTGTAAAWSLSTLLPSLVAQATVPEERGRVLGFIHLWWNLAMIIGSMVGGALFEVASGLPFLVTGTINIFSLALLFAFYRLVVKKGAGEDL